MKIAITADLHLRNREDHPERYNALENIIEQIEAENIKTLIIAGDLFDKDSRNYSDFEKICKKHGKVQLLIIPGNHDPDISGKKIVGDNIHIYSSPSIIKAGSTRFLFIPYEAKSNMGEKIAEKKKDIQERQWVLVAHGDYYGGVRQPNPMEPGIYMPLSRKDLEMFNPRIVFLGHIHKPLKLQNVHYAGSPCGMDINETGKRKFLVYDTTTGIVEDKTVITDVLYFNESFVVVPLEDEVPRLKQEIESRIQSWDINSSDYEKVRVRVDARGYAADKGAISTALEQGFGKFRFYNDEGPRIDNLSVSSDRQLNAIAERAMKLTDELKWNFGGIEPTKEQVVVAALSSIYGD